MQRRGKFGRPFYGCDRYPKCDYIVNDLAQVGEYTPDASAPPASAKATAAPKRSAARTAKPKAAVAPNGKEGKTAPHARTTQARTKKARM